MRSAITMVVRLVFAAGNGWHHRGVRHPEPVDSVDRPAGAGDDAVAGGPIAQVPTG
jgi:hypothetical protein